MGVLLSGGKRFQLHRRKTHNTESGVAALRCKG